MRCDHYDAGTCRSCSLLPQPYERQLAGKEEAGAAARAPRPGGGGALRRGPPRPHLHWSNALRPL